ncbi:MAG: 4Fe-4S binding protein [Gammaproteobacteria bacterium]|nr:4Fe-4S binding protein [Gammaproteobacteria bacterium]
MGDGVQAAPLEVIERLAREFFPAADQVTDFEGTPPAAAVFHEERLLGYVILTDEVAKIPAYSGEPISTLVGFDTAGRITGVEIVKHAEPILVVGISDQDLKRFVDQYLGKVVTDRIKIGGEERSGYVTVDGISGATITGMVLNATITRSVRQVAASRGIPLPADVGFRTAEVSSPGVTAAPQTEPSLEPIWIQVWQERTFRIAVLCVGLVLLTTILVFQDWITRYPSLLITVRRGFLIYTLFFIGWYSLAQLSVVNVMTFVTALMRDFNWDTFLIDPMLFILWSYVALTILLWGRGIYCGWLCPFGALQELLHDIATRLRVWQFPIPAVVHERLLALKYILLLSLFAISLHSMSDAVRYAEVEPFKTAINMHFQREWTFVLYAGVLVAISLFNGKFYCKYLCPLGAALTIPSHFRIFDWLRRRKECGRPCQTCAAECPSQAIRPTGEINANECHYCLDCQVTYWNAHRCPPLVEKRKRLEKTGRPLPVQFR